jgi:hypothetical protein
MSSNKTVVRVLNGANVIANTSATDNAFVADSGNVVFRDADGQYTKRVYKGLSGMRIEKSEKEFAQSTTVSFTAAADTEYAFWITQDIDSPAAGTGLGRERISYIKETLPTDAEVEAGLAAVIEAFVKGNKLQVTVVQNGSGSITITGKAGYPLFDIAGESNVTAAAAQPTVAGHATAGTAVSGTTTVTLTSAAAHGMVVGQYVSVVACAGFDVTVDGVLYEDYIPKVRIATVPTTTTMTLDGVVGTGTNTTNSPVFTKEANEDRGQGADLSALGVADAFYPDAALSAIGSSDAYTAIIFDDSSVKSVSGVDGSVGKQDGVLVIYVEEDATNYADVIDRAVEVQSGYAYGTTDADSALIAV